MELRDESEVDTWRGVAEEVRFCYGGASLAGGGASRERGRLLQVVWLLLEGGCRNL